MDITLKPVYIGMCVKGQIFWEFSLMWVQVTYLLSFHMARYCLDLTFHYPSEALYKEPFGYIEGGELKSKKTIVHCCCSLYLILHPFFPWRTWCSSKISFSCDLAIGRWRIEVVEAQVEDSVSPIRRHADRGCHLCNL